MLDDCQKARLGGFHTRDGRPHDLGHLVDLRGDPRIRGINPASAHPPRQHVAAEP